jgi:hypothetical protein
VTASSYPEDPFAAFRGLYGPRARRQARARQTAVQGQRWTTRAVQAHLAQLLLDAPGGQLDRRQLAAGAPSGLLRRDVTAAVRMECRHLAIIGAVRRDGDRVVIVDRAKLRACLPTPVERTGWTTR